jgi:flagellar basal-body rod protein FlgB
MNLENLPIFRLSRLRMDHAAERQRLIAQNVANADTPGYRPVDLKPIDFDRALSASSVRPIGVSVTNEKHIATAGSNSARPVDGRSRGWETAPAGNGVVLEEQMLRGAQVQVDTQMAMGLYRKSLSLLKTAIGGRGS